MSDKCFVDTNILLYARDTSEPAKQIHADGLLRRLWVEQSGRTSVQVLNEFYVNATRKLAFPMSPAEAWYEAECFMVWKPVPMDMGLMHGAWRIQSRFGHSWWDSLIIAAAEQAGCATLYSEDLQHNQQYFSVRVCNPFL